MPYAKYPASQPMRIQARPGSAAEKKYYAGSALPKAWPMPKAIAPGIDPAPLEDLIYHGGKVVNALFADGSVHAIPSMINGMTWRNLGSRQDNNVVKVEW